MVEHLTRSRPIESVHNVACDRKDCPSEGETCTLLGPEGPDVLRTEPTEPLGPSCLSEGHAGGHRPYFENYTVDASILETMRKHRFTNE